MCKCVSPKNGRVGIAPPRIRRVRPFGEHFLGRFLVELAGILGKGRQRVLTARRYGIPPVGIHGITHTVFGTSHHTPLCESVRAQTR